MPVFFAELLKTGRVDQAIGKLPATPYRDRLDWWVPVLYTRLKDGQLWREETGEVSATTTPSCLVPVPVTPDFIGREIELAHHRKRLNEETSVQSLLVWIGTGKTYLGAKLAC